VFVFRKQFLQPTMVSGFGEVHGCANVHAFDSLTLHLQHCLAQVHVPRLLNIKLLTATPFW
jgi:hypothetical protein